jgi:hypothetical protein
MTVTKVWALAAAAVVAGCGGGSVAVPKGPIELDEMRSDSRPYYWLGEEFEGLELWHAEPYSGRFANVIYGTCEAPTGLLAESSCSPPLQVQNVLCADGTSTVALFSDGGGRSARAAKALRPLNGAARRAGEARVTFDRSVLC